MPIAPTRFRFSSSYSYTASCFSFGRSSLRSFFRLAFSVQTSGQFRDGNLSISRKVFSGNELSSSNPVAPFDVSYDGKLRFFAFVVAAIPLVHPYNRLRKLPRPVAEANNTACLSPRSWMSMHLKAENAVFSHLADNSFRLMTVRPHPRAELLGGHQMLSFRLQFKLCSVSCTAASSWSAATSRSSRPPFWGERDQ